MKKKYYLEFYTSYDKLWNIWKISRNGFDTLGELLQAVAKEGTNNDYTMGRTRIVKRPENAIEVFE